MRWLLLAVCLVLLVAPGAYAHRLVEDDGTHTGPETAIILEDVELSQVVYHEFTEDSNELWLGFDGEVGQELYWQLGIPALEELVNYRPAVAVLGPGLPAVEVPFEVPEGLGGIVFETDGVDGEFFYEPFTGTKSWVLATETMCIQKAGRYYLVLYHPTGDPGKAWLAVGRREEFGLQDILSYEQVLGVVRDFHEESAARLSLLNYLLIGVSRLTNFVVSLFS